MANKNKSRVYIWFCAIIAGVFFISAIQSCGKSATAIASNIQYEVLNFSPDIGALTLYVNYLPEGTSATNPYIYGVNQGYFYLTPPTYTPFQFRPYVLNGQSGTTLLARTDSLRSNVKYSLFIAGSVTASGGVKQIFTVDTASLPAVGRGKVRFVDASPSGTGGLDVYANGTKAFSSIVYPNYTSFIQLPIGTYDFQITAPGSTAVLNDQPNITITDGRVYTIYAYGYTTRSDSAAFNAGIITNQ